MDDRPSTEPNSPTDGAVFSAYRRTQAMVGIASVLCILIFWETGKALGIPPVPKVNGSLLGLAHWPVAILATYVLFVIAMVIGILVGGRSWFFAGVFTAAVGMATLSIRGGPMHYVLFNAAAQGDTQKVFLRLLAEQCLVFLPIALAWSFVWRRYQAALPAAEPGESVARDGVANTAGAVLTQLVVMGLIVHLFSPTDAKKQVTVSVFLGAFGGAALGEYLFPNRRAAAWYWLAPFLVGAIGYVFAYTHAADWTTGEALGPLAHLAHALPLDYAGAGVAGALLGYWISAERPAVAFSLRPHSSSRTAAPPPAPPSPARTDAAQRNA